MSWYPDFVRFSFQAAELSREWEMKIATKEILSLDITVSIKIPDIDGVLTIDYKGNAQKFYVEVKKELREFQIMDLLYHVRENQPFLVVAETIFPKVKEILKEHGIGYIEINGNIIQFRQL